MQARTRLKDARVSPDPVAREPCVQVALNAAGGAQAMAIAAQLARSLDWMLEGVFVEDENLLDMAGLPFLRELSAGTLTQQAMDPGRMLQALAVRSRQIEDMLFRQAAESSVRCRFRTWRGHKTLAALHGALDAGILGVPGTPAYRQPLFGAGREPVTDLYLVLDGRELTERFIRIVRGLRERLSFAVTVAVQAGIRGIEAGLGLEARRAAAALESATTADFRDAQDLFGRFDGSASPVLFVGADHPLLREPELERQLRSFAGTLFIVRA